MNKSKKSGFTLVELMVVAAIIAILAAIIIPLLTDNRTIAVEAEGKNYCGAAMNAAKAYYAREGTWSSDLATIDSELASDQSADWDVVVSGDNSDPVVTATYAGDADYTGDVVLDGEGSWDSSDFAAD